jgi:hypothetical protein
VSAPRSDLLEALDWIARLGAVSAEAIAERSGTSVASARARLHSAHRSGLLECWRPLHARPALFTITREGLHAAGLKGLEQGRVSPSGAEHALECASVAVTLERLYPDRVLSGLPELRRRERAAGEALASAPIRNPSDGVTLLHRPDLVLWPGPDSAERPIAVEVELTVKAPLRLASICRAWARSRAVEGVLYLAADKVLAPLERAIEKSQAHGRIVAVELDLFQDGHGLPIGCAVPSAP